MDHDAPNPPPAADSSEVVVMLILQFKPGSAAAVQRRMIPSVRSTRAELGNNQFEFFKAKGGEDRFVVFERWKSQAALEQHWREPHTKDALALFGEYLVRPLSDTEDVIYLDDLMKQEG